MKHIRNWLLGSCVMMLAGTATAQEKEAPAPRTIREGEHKFSLQWIGWGEQFGKATIKKLTDSTYQIDGEHLAEQSDDYASIHGVLTMITPRRLKFEGMIETYVKNHYESQVCRKEGKYTFHAKDQRKYWRLQEMENCEKSGLVDYVDIYF